MKRFLGCAFAMFIALVAIALVGGDSGAVAGHGCHGRHRCHGRHHGCHGGLLARLHAKHAKCHGEEASACGACGSGECSGCGEVAGDCGSCAGGCAGGACGGEAVISSGKPTEAAPVAPAAPASGT